MTWEQGDLEKLMQSTGGDNAPDKSVSDLNIDEDELSTVLQNDFLNDICDREEMGWSEKREYDLRAYYGVKDPEMQNFPYPGASAYPVPITTVQLDTGHALIDDVIWRNGSKCVVVNPISDEDIKKAKNLEFLLNWQFINDIKNVRRVDSIGNMLGLLHGTSYEKIIRIGKPNENRIATLNCPIQNIYLPIDAEGPEIDQSDHIIHLIPLSANDMRERIGSGVYKNLDKVGKGFLPGGENTPERLRQLQQEISGLSLSAKNSRDTYWIAEVYKTYYPKGSVRPIELVCWFSPSTGAILRVIENKEDMRPFVDKYFYENPGYAYHFSLPERLRNIQEKANYSDKQATDAIDKAISPAMFYNGTDKFDPRMNFRAPTAAYPMQNVNSIQWEPVNIAPILAQRNEIRNLYLEAERITGFTDLQQGISTAASANTLGQDVLRSKSADTRFRKIIKLVDHHWNKKVNKVYQYDNLYMPRSTKVKVLGINKYESLDKLFPKENINDAAEKDSGLGLTGKFSFSIANQTLDEQESLNQKKLAFYGTVISHPVLGADKGTIYRAFEQQAEANGISDFEMVVKMPKEAMQLTPDEVIAKLYEGEEVLPDPDIQDFPEYIKAIDIFMRSGNFNDLSDDIRQKFITYQTILKKMNQAKVLAFQDFQAIKNPPVTLMPQPDVQPGPQQLPPQG